jgi:chromosome segregation protein
MKIKRLSMIGFKSFMDRIEVSFPGGISAVVGPNGCGKSNIVDAIRWAMGEQSIKQLRGRQMEDVIFNGSGDFKPMGMAEVSVVFENSDGHFPPEFARDSEMSITRRLYRSGESEYLLNNVPCRLKDVQEIFMDTGLGNRAYSIIGQGKIGTIIEQRPEETRILIEEAAGITKYKKKVEESQRRLERTKGNLERVEDILMEVQRQMRSLKRQASKAKRFKFIGQEIQKLELLLHSHSYHELKEESSNRNKSTEELIQRDVALSTELSGIQARIVTMTLERDEKENEVSSLRDTFLNLKEQFNNKKSLLQSLEGEKRMQGDLEKRLKQERDDTGGRITAFEEERAALGEEVEKKKQRAGELEDEISLLNKRLKSRNELLNEAKDEYERARIKVNSGMTKEVGLNKESGYLTKRIGEITDSSARLENEQNDVRMKIEHITNASRRKSETRQALVQRLKAIEEDIFREQKRCDELDQIKKDIETDLNSTEADLNLDQSRLSSLHSLTENFEGYKIGVRTIMKANDLKARSEGRIMGLVADIIDVQPQHEQAVEAVLADKLQYIIVESQRDGKEAIDYLKIRAKGRSSFVPLADLTQGKSHGNGNGLPLLRDLVSVADSYKPLVEILLGDAALVKDLDEAISSWRNNGKDLCLVTPEGDMVDKRGIISGGKLAHSSHGLLARKREIKALEEKIVRSKRKVEELKTRLEERNNEMEEKRSSLNDLVEEKSECQEKINDLDKGIFRLSQELDQLQKLSERISRELEQKGKEQAKHKEALRKIEAELELYGETKRAEEEYLLLKEAELKETEEEFDQIRNELEKQKMALNLSREEVKGLLRERERIDEFIEESKQKLKRTEQDILEGQARVRECLKKEEALEEELKEFFDILEKAEGAVKAAEQERNRFQSTIREEDKKAETVRGDLENLRETISRARMEQSGIRIKMDNLIEMAKERFNLNLHEIYKENLEEDFSPIETKERLEHQKKRKERLGDVNLTAIQEYEALKERYTFITEQREDLINSVESINQAIRKINRTSRERFIKTLEEVDNKLKHVFPILFNGGTAGLRLVDETKPLESGVLVEVLPPGKRLSHMGLLSGGEKALVAMALLFAIYLIKPSPFCLLDEVDAPLDEANIERFNNLLNEIKKYSQILLVTHNRKSMEIVDSLYGVTMEKAGISKMVSVELQSRELH